MPQNVVDMVGGSVTSIVLRLESDRDESPSQFHPWPSHCTIRSSISSEDEHTSASSAGTEVNAHDGSCHNSKSCYFS